MCRVLSDIVIVISLKGSMLCHLNASADIDSMSGDMGVKLPILKKRKTNPRIRSMDLLERAC